MMISKKFAKINRKNRTAASRGFITRCNHLLR